MMKREKNRFATRKYFGFDVLPSPTNRNGHGGRLRHPGNEGEPRNKRCRKHGFSYSKPINNMLDKANTFAHAD